MLLPFIEHPLSARHPLSTSPPWAPLTHGLALVLTSPFYKREKPRLRDDGHRVWSKARRPAGGGATSYLMIFGHSSSLMWGDDSSSPSIFIVLPTWRPGQRGTVQRWRGAKAQSPFSMIPASTCFPPVTTTNATPSRQERRPGGGSPANSCHLGRGPKGGGQRGAGPERGGAKAAS